MPNWMLYQAEILKAGRTGLQRRGAALRQGAAAARTVLTGRNNTAARQPLESSIPNPQNQSKPSSLFLEPFIPFTYYL